MTETCPHCGVVVELLQDYPLDAGPSWFHVDGTDPYKQCRFFAQPSDSVFPKR